jgi:hypothetical protein
LRITTSVSGPGNSTIKVAASVNVATAVTMAASSHRAGRQDLFHDPLAFISH